MHREHEHNQKLNKAIQNSILMVEFVSETIERHVTQEDVGERLLKIEVEKHKRMHEEKGETHHVEIRHNQTKVSEKEEQLIESFKKQDPLAKQSEYNRITADKATSIGNYGGSSDAGAYGHSHASAEAGCSCQWKQTSEGAIRDAVEKNNEKEHGAYSRNALAGQTKSYHQNESLEGSINNYSSPGDPGTNYN